MILENGLYLDGFDDCVLGVCHRIGQDDIVAYDKAKIIRKLMDRDNMSMNGAMEYFEYNILGSFQGKKTPCFITKKEDSDDF